MIAHLKGTLIQKSPESVIIDVAGIGYEVFIPLSTFYKLPDVQQAVSLTTYTHVREDALQLYGFLTQREKELFQLLISVSGVGPRLARNILSGISTDELVAAVAGGDLARLKAIPGIGGKTAERLVVELRDKMHQKFEPSHVAPRHDDKAARDVLSALVNLGYKGNHAEKAVEKAKKSHAHAEFEVLLKESLKLLAEG